MEKLKFVDFTQRELLDTITATFKIFSQRIESYCILAIKLG